MKKRSLYLILPVITVILELLPYGAVLNFMRPSVDGTTIGHFRELYSYFDLTPFGYANFAPFLTAVTTCAVLALLILYGLTGKRGLALAARSILAMAAVVSLGPLMFGISYYSLVGGLITATLAAELFVLHRGLRAEEA